MDIYVHIAQLRLICSAHPHIYIVHQRPNDVLHCVYINTYAYIYIIIIIIIIIITTTIIIIIIIVIIIIIYIINIIYIYVYVYVVSCIPINILMFSSDRPQLYPCLMRETQCQKPTIWGWFTQALPHYSMY